MSKDLINYILKFFKGKRIDEYYIKRKLYYYLLKEEYQKALKTSAIDTRFDGDTSWDINDIFYNQLEYNGNAVVDDSNKEIIDKMIEEILTCYDIERNSKNLTRIFSINPNQEYKLIYGVYNNELLSYELITNGDIKCTKFIEDEGDFYLSPKNTGEFIQLEDGIAKMVDIVNSTYASLQAISEKNLNYVYIFTEETNKDKLENMANISNVKYQFLDHALSKTEPYVRKLIIK